MAASASTMSPTRITSRPLSLLWVRQGWEWQG